MQLTNEGEEKARKSILNNINLIKRNRQLSKEALEQ